MEAHKQQHRVVAQIRKYEQNNTSWTIEQLSQDTGISKQFLMETLPQMIVLKQGEARFDAPLTAHHGNASDGTLHTVTAIAYSTQDLEETFEIRDLRHWLLSIAKAKTLQGRPLRELEVALIQDYFITTPDGTPLLDTFAQRFHCSRQNVQQSITKLQRDLIAAYHSQTQTTSH